MDKELQSIRPDFLPEKKEISHITMADGMRLRAGFFPAHGQSRATILLVGGHREFLEKHTEFIEDFQRRGFDVYSYDHRGQGGSDRMLENRKKSHNPDFSKIVSDMDEIVVRHVKAAELDHPLYLISHSMGCQIAFHYLHDHKDVFDRAVLMVPFTDFNIGGTLFTWGTKVYTMLANLLGFSEFFAPGQARHKDMIDHEYAFLRLTHDRARYDWSQQALDAKPELFIGGVTFGWIKGVMKSMKALHQDGYTKSIATETLILLAEDEQVIDNDMTIRLANDMPNATVETISGARHEMYREKDEVRDQVIEKIVAFFS